MRDLIEGLGKIQIDDINGVAFIHQLGEYLQVLKEVSEARLPIHETML